MRNMLVIVVVLAAATLACVTDESEVADTSDAANSAAPADRGVDPSQPDSRPRFETDALGDVWQWEGMTTPVEQIVVDNPSLYTIRFQSDGEVEIRADCNRGFGRYTVTEERKLEFGPFGVTRAICPPESLSDRYLRELARATTLFFADGDLYLELPYDSGTLKFSRHAEQSAAE